MSFRSTAFYSNLVHILQRHFSPCHFLIWFLNLANVIEFCILFGRSFHIFAPLYRNEFKHQPYFIATMVYLTFNIYNVQTHNTKYYLLIIYYHSHTFTLMIYNFSIMYTAWCLTLYHNPIYCWALIIYNYYNLLPIPL